MNQITKSIISKIDKLIYKIDPREQLNQQQLSELKKYQNEVQAGLIGRQLFGPFIMWRFLIHPAHFELYVKSFKAHPNAELVESHISFRKALKKRTPNYPVFYRKSGALIQQIKIQKNFIEKAEEIISQASTSIEDINKKEFNSVVTTGYARAKNNQTKVVFFDLNNKSTVRILLRFCEQDEHVEKGKALKRPLLKREKEGNFHYIGKKGLFTPFIFLLSQEIFLNVPAEAIISKEIFNEAKSFFSFKSKNDFSNYTAPSNYAKEEFVRLQNSIAAILTDEEKYWLEQKFGPK